MSSTRKRRLLVPLLTILLVYVAFALLIALAQRSLMYLPPRGSGLAVRGGEAVSFDIDVGKARGSVWNSGRDEAVLFFGGNAELVTASAAELALLVGDRTLYVVDYRGYGESDGSPEEAGLRADALRIFDAIASRHQRVSLLARSLGTALAVWVASRRPVGKLALISPFDSMLNVARGHYWWLPVSLLLRDRYQAARWAPAVEAETLVVIAAEDRVIPPPRSRALVEHLRPGLARVVEIPRCGHNDLSLAPGFPGALREFFQAAPSGRESPENPRRGR